MATIKRIGIMTSGGDCAGLNAAIRAVVRHATLTYGWEVVGIRQATQGLMTTPPLVVPLTPAGVEDLLTRGGTMLGTTNQGNPFAFRMPDGSQRDRSQEILENYERLGLDAFIGIGGDGSLAILRRLAQQGGLNFVGIPKTIDNDVNLTERSIGFDTAVNIATEALDRLHFTAASHSRVMILEVMGRDAGHIALCAGIAGGADVILIPEIPYTFAHVASKIREVQREGKTHALVIVAEAVRTETQEQVGIAGSQGSIRLGGIGQYLGDRLSQETGAETRVMTLGHLQRGGTPSPLDRLVATAFGVAAVDLIAQGCYDRMVTWQRREVVSVPIEEAIAHYAAVPLEGSLVHTARSLGICLGDTCFDQVCRDMVPGEDSAPPSSWEPEPERLGRALQPLASV